MKEMRGQEDGSDCRDKDERFTISRRDSCTHERQRRTSPSSLTNERITDVEPIVATQKWMVKHFPSFLEFSTPDLYLRSTPFNHLRNPEVLWQLCLSSEANLSDNLNMVSLSLDMFHVSGMEEMVVKVNCRICILDDDDDNMFSKFSRAEFHVKSSEGVDPCNLLYISAEEIKNYLRTDHSLVLFVTVAYLSDAGRIPCRLAQLTTMAIVEIAEVSRAHKKNERAMFTKAENCPYSDINVVGGFGENRMVFAAHKYKLWAHSDVFRAMLEHNMEESQKSMIVIDEFCSAAVRNMLLFIYSGAISLHDLDLKEASDVLQLAQKYNIPALKTMSEKHLIPRVSAANLIVCLELADFHQANYLYEHCLDFIKANKCVAFHTEAWSALRDRNARLCNSIMDRMNRSYHKNSPPVKRSRLQQSK